MFFKNDSINFFWLVLFLSLIILLVAIFADFTPNFLFEFFDKYVANVMRIHQEEITDIRAQLSQARAGEVALRKNLEENYEYNRYLL